MKPEISGQRSEIRGQRSAIFRLSVIPFSVAALALFYGCVSAKFPTPNGIISTSAFCHKADLPRGTYSVTVTSPSGISTNTTIVIEGYTGAGDADSITATAGGIRTLIEGAAAGAAKGAK
jgi:hypothetical protein